MKNDTGQLEYCLSAKFKNVKYVFDVAAGADAAELVAEIDRRSLRLEKSIANNGAVPAQDGGKSPRGQRPVLFDADLQQQEAKPKQKVTQVAGSRFRVKMIMEDGMEHKAVAIVSKESITIVDPTTATGDNPNAVHYRACKWAGERISNLTVSSQVIFF